MDAKALKPTKFAVDPNSQDARRQWLHWHKSFTSYLAKLGSVTEEDKLNLLINHVDAAVYELFCEAVSFEAAIELLKEIYAKAPNPIFARYMLKCCKQQMGEPLDSFFQNLKKLSLDCDFKAVTDVVHRNEAVRDAFIAGIVSNNIRQRLLEERNQDLQAIFDKARSLEIAHKNSELFNVTKNVQIPMNYTAAVVDSNVVADDINAAESCTSYAAPINPICFFLWE